MLMSIGEPDCKEQVDSRMLHLWTDEEGTGKAGHRKETDRKTDVNTKFPAPVHCFILGFCEQSVPPEVSSVNTTLLLDLVNTIPFVG